jgi:hypothetical protein
MTGRSVCDPVCFPDDCDAGGPGAGEPGVLEGELGVLVDEHACGDQVAAYQLGHCFGEALQFAAGVLV